MSDRKISTISVLFLGASALSTLLMGCSDQESRLAKRAKLLEDLRQSVDLNGVENPDLEKGEVAPMLTGINLDGEPLSMEAHKGKVILVSFLGET